MIKCIGTYTRRYTLYFRITSSGHSYKGTDVASYSRLCYNASLPTTSTPYINQRVQMISTNPNPSQELANLTDTVKSTNTITGHELSMMLGGMSVNRCDDLGVKKMLEVLGDKLEMCEDEVNIKMCMTGLENIGSSSSESQRLLSLLAKRLCDVPTLSPLALADILYSMRNMRSEDAGVLSLVRELDRLVRVCSNQMSTAVVVRCLQGLSGLSSVHSEVSRLVGALAPRVMSSEVAMGPRDIAMSMSSLRRKDSGSKDTRLLLSALQKKLRNNSSAHFDAESLVMCVNCLQSCSVCPPVEGILQELVPHIDLCSDFTGTDISRMMIGLQNMTSASNAVNDILYALNKSIRSLERGSMSNEDAAMALSGMKRMTTESKAVVWMLNNLSDRLKEREDTIHDSFIHMAFTGFQSMNFRASRDNINKKLLQVLAGKLRHNLTLRSTHVSVVASVLRGLQNFSSDNDAVRGVLAQVRHILWEGRGRMSATDVKNCLLGMQSMTCEHNGVPELLAALIPHLNRCNDVFTSSDISWSVYGLRYMGSENRAVRGVLKALSHRLSCCDSVFSTRDVSNMAYGLQGMVRGSTQLKGLLTEFTSRILACHDEFTFVEFSSALYGMQGFDVTHSESRDIVVAMCTRRFSERDINAYSMQFALFGLINAVQNRIDQAESLAVVLLDHTESILSRNPNQRLKEVYWLSLWQAVAFMSHSPSELRSELKQRLDIVRTLLYPRLPYTLSTERKSYMERKVANRLKILLQERPHISMSCGEIFDGFSTDIMLKVSRCSGTIAKYDVYNIETDGPSHLVARKMSYFNRRDAYLLDVHNIKVIRLKQHEFGFCSGEKLDGVLIDHLKPYGILN